MSEYFMSNLRKKLEFVNSRTNLNLLVDPRLGGMSVAHELLRLEPKGDLLLGRVDGVRAVTDVSADIDAKVASDGAWGGSERVCGAEHGSALLDGVLALPNHGTDWATVHVVDKSSEEALAAEVGVVLLEVSLAWHAELHGDQLVASLLESSDNVGDKASLDTVRLDGNEGSLG